MIVGLGYIVEDVVGDDTALCDVAPYIVRHNKVS